MELAHVALMIAVLSLAWNVVSSFLTWRRTRPNVVMVFNASVSARRKDTNESCLWFKVTAVNNGGTATTVTELGFLYSAEVGWAWQALPDELADSAGDAVLGPRLPAKLEAHSGLTWFMDAASCARSMRENQILLVHVELSNGRRATAEIAVDEWSAEEVNRVLAEREAMSEVEDLGLA